MGELAAGTGVVSTQALGSDAGATPRRRGRSPRLPGGRRVISHYRVLERIGQGGMGVVYKAQDLRLDREVALKFLPHHLLDSTDAVARFRREARAISALNHPHIATIYELGESGGEIFLALEYLPGGTVRALVRNLASRGEQLPARRLMEFAAGIAEALDHAHQRGIVHRDVKTDNVMLAADGAVKLTDFGLAKHPGVSEVTGNGNVLGTVAYMSPEQATGAAVDHRSDIFSLGVVLYEMATGNLPFRGPHEAAILSKILNATTPSLREARADLPEEFDRIVRKALEKDKEHRYQNMGEMLADLRVAACSAKGLDAVTSAVTQPLTGTRVVPFRAGRRPWLWISVLSAVAAIGTAVGVPSIIWSEVPVAGKPPAAYDLYLEGRGRLLRYEDAENLDRAIALFGRALREQPNYALAHAGLGEAYWRKYKLTKEAQWIEPAGENCRRAIDLGANLGPVHFTLGLIHADTGRHAEAIREFERVLAVDPLNADAYRELGNALEVSGRHQEAESAFRKAIEFRPRDWAAHNSLGRFYWQRGRYADAETCFAEVIRLTPDNARGYSNLGGLYVMMGRYERAASLLERSIGIKPTAAAYSNLGTAYYFQGRYREAASMMEKAVELRPGDHQVWGNLGDVRRRLPGSAEAAREAYGKASDLAWRQLAVNEGDAELHADLAMYHAGLGQRSRAVAEAHEAERRAPASVGVLFRCALAYELAGRRGEALASLRSAVRGGYSTEEVRRHPDLRALRNDPRYDVEAAGLPAPAGNGKRGGQTVEGVSK